MEIKKNEFRKIANEVMDENALRMARSIKEDIPLLKIPDVLLVEMYMWKFLLCEIEKKLFEMTKMTILNSCDDWLSSRKSRIGGSDAAAVIGKSKWMSNVDLWEIKTGRKK